MNHSLIVSQEYSNVENVRLFACYYWLIAVVAVLVELGIG
jgi:hypothetical protein